MCVYIYMYIYVYRKIDRQTDRYIHDVPLSRRFPTIANLLSFGKRFGYF